MKKNYQYRTPEHDKRMKQLFPRWIHPDFPKISIWKKGLEIQITNRIHYTQGFENDWWLELSINYDIQKVSPTFSEKLEYKDYRKAGKIWMFFNENDIIIPSIQGEGYLLGSSGEIFIESIL